MTAERVSIFLPTFSRLSGGYLERAVTSILDQTCSDFELIIIDDASFDGSESRIRHFAKQDSRIRHIRLERHVGLPAYLIGLAYRQSRGQFLAFAYDDCRLAPDHLEQLLQGFQRHPDAGMVYGQAELVWSDGNRRTIGDPYDPLRMAAGNNHIPNVSAMVRRQAVEEVGLYDPHVLLARYYDWDLWQRIAKRYPLAFVPKVIAEERGVSLTDSIGNTYAPFHPLLFKYIRMDRNAKLKPQVIHLYDPYGLEFDAGFDAEELKIANERISEHFAILQRKNGHAP